MFLTLVSKTDQSGSVVFKCDDYVLAREYVDVHLLALQTLTEQIQLCE
jgi:hypothetical protein